MRYFSYFLLFFFCLSSVYAGTYRLSDVPGGSHWYYIDMNSSRSEALSACLSYVAGFHYNNPEGLCIQNGSFDEDWPEYGNSYVAAGWLYDQTVDQPTRFELAFFGYPKMCSYGATLEVNVDGRWVCRKYCPPNTTGLDCLPEPEEETTCTRSSNPISYFGGEKYRRETVVSIGDKNPIEVAFKYNNHAGDLITFSGVASSHNTRVMVAEFSPNSEPWLVDYAVYPFSLESSTFEDGYITGTERKYIGHSDQYWRSSYEDYLAPDTIQSDEDTLYLHDGRIIRFKDGKSDAFPEYSVQKSGAGEAAEYSVTVTGKPKRIFNADGALIRKEFAGGAVHTLFYEGADLSRIEHSGGYVVHIDVDASGQYTRLTSAAGTVDIDWLTVDLSSRVTMNQPDGIGPLYAAFPLIETIRYNDPDGTLVKNRRFEYTDTRFPASMTAIYDYDPSVSDTEQLYAEFRYDDQGRAVYSSLRDGIDEVQVAYPDEDTRIVTNALGRETTYTFDTVAGARRLVSVEGEAGPNCQLQNTSFTYHPSGRKAAVNKEGVINNYPDSDTSGATVKAAGTEVEETTYIVKDLNDPLQRPASIEHEQKTEHYLYENGNLREYRVEPQGWKN